MRLYFLLLLLLLFAVSSAWAQDYSSYEKPIEKIIYSEVLKDSVHLEITLPIDLKVPTNTEYPIIYLLDRQLRNNYKYNLYTIDYLSTLQSIPKAIVIGITFNRKNRASWTLPNASGGKADDMISFIVNELNDELKNNYRISEFNLLIGHSRTAIFSSYALSKKPDFFNATISNSVSNFDFGDRLQKKQFETFLDAIGNSTHKYYYYFSVGENAYGDLHESAVDTLNSFLISRELPKTLEWRYYKHKTAHDITPGLTVSKSLNEIFKEYGRRYYQCLKIARDSTHIVPWYDYSQIYVSISTELGFNIQPSELFFNSIASEYYNDYDGNYGKNNLNFALEILLKAIEAFPNDYGYYTWIGEIYITLKDYKKGGFYLNQSSKLINQDKALSEADREDILIEIKDLRKMIK
jgi:predicted alpha/beta superfamily hydrolase